MKHVPPPSPSPWEIDGPSSRNATPSEVEDTPVDNISNAVGHDLLNENHVCERGDIVQVRIVGVLDSLDTGRQPIESHGIEVECKRDRSTRVEFAANNQVAFRKQENLDCPLLSPAARNSRH